MLRNKYNQYHEWKPNQRLFRTNLMKWICNEHRHFAKHHTGHQRSLIFYFHYSDADINKHDDARIIIIV